jgi:hypothetical protein
MDNSTYGVLKVLTTLVVGKLTLLIDISNSYKDIIS